MSLDPNCGADLAIHDDIERFRRKMILLIVATGIFVVVAVCVASSELHAQALTPVSTASEFNMWIVGLGILCVVLAVLVILARNGHLGGASASVTSAANTASVDAQAMVTLLEGLLTKAHDTIAAMATAVAKPAPTPAPTAAPSSAGFVLPPRK